MKPKLASLLVVIAILLAVGAEVFGQDLPAVDAQIKQKEAELQRLKEIKLRLEKIKKLEDEIKQLQSGQNVSSGTSPQPPANDRATPTPTPAGPGGSPSVPATRAPVMGAPANREMLSTSVSSLASVSDPTLTPLRSCSEIALLSEQQTSRYEQYFCNKVEELKDMKKANSRASFDLVRTDFLTFMIALLAREGRAQYVLAAENERADKEVGSDASSSGSTSLVTKGSVPSILGFAVNTGALLQTTNGSTITFRGNMAGLAKAMAGKGFISGYDEDSPTTRFLRRAAFSFSFDPNRGNQPGVFTGSKQQISNYSFHVDLYNKRDPREARYREEWKNFLSKQSEDLVLEIQNSQVALLDISNGAWLDPTLQSWYIGADTAMRNASTGEVEAVLREQLSKIPKDLSPNTLARLATFSLRLKAWLDARESILDRIAKAPIVSFEYTNDRPINSSSLSKFNFIAETGFGSRLDLTFNGSLTMFNQRPTIPGVSRVRDFQFATQFDAPLGEMGLGIGKPVLSFAGRFERLMSDVPTIAGTIAPNTKGDIAVGQIKFTIPIKGSGIRIPFSLSFANRTELLKEREIRGNFGFTFDLDTLFAKFKPF